MRKHFLSFPLSNVIPFLLMLSREYGVVLLFATGLSVDF